MMNLSQQSSNDDLNNNKKLNINQLVLVDKSNVFQPKVLVVDCLTKNSTERSYKSKNKNMESIICSICNKRFAFQYILTDHMKIFHQITKKFNCKNCELKFFSLRDLLDHEWTHKGKKPFNCKICGMEFIRGFDMLDHMEKIHNEKLFRCKICSEQFSMEDNLKLHERIHLPDDKKFSCIICKKIFISFQNRVSHEQIHSRDEIKCVICSAKYSSCCKLREHLTKSHKDDSINLIPKKKTEKKIFHCGVCDENIFGEINYRYHSRSHLPDDMKFVCQKCPRSFMKNSALRNHELTHQKPPPTTKFVNKELIRCKICSKTYSSEIFLRKHHNLRHSNPNLFCDICQEDFRTKNDLKYHRRSHLPENEQFRCDRCPLIFLTRSNLRNHRETHNPEKRFKCNLCGLHYKSKESVTRHKNVCHENSETVTCDICGLIYCSIEKLELHTNRSHKIEQKTCWQCQICHRNFSTRKNLKRHEINQQHRPKLTSKLFLCPTCDEVFSNEKTYRDHQKTHEESFSCSTCFKEFLMKETLQLHEQIHLTTNFECEVCGKKFKLHETLIEHQLQHKEDMATQKDLEEFIADFIEIEPLIDEAVEADEEILDMNIWQLNELLADT